MKTSQHGTNYRYEKHGCRCPLCVENHRARIAAERQARLEAGRLNHGTRSAYDAGCRCPDCRRVRSEIARREWARVKAKRAAS